MYKQYAKDEQMNFQMNRFLEPYYTDKEVQTDVEKACHSIHDLESWFTQWNDLAYQMYQLKRYDVASAYFQLAEFFLKESEPRKNETYTLFKETFYKSIVSEQIDFFDVPYENHQLPAAVITRKTATKWLIFHGGFDSYLEELIRLSFSYLSDLNDYNIGMFEGPGQGQLIRNHIPMTPYWGKPVAAVLDFFKLDGVCLLGMSLGGYLALRAAAKEKRIREVIAFDTFYSLEDAFLMKAPKELAKLPDLKNVLVRKSVDILLSKYAKKHIDLQFKLNKAKEIFCKTTPSEVLMEMKKYTLNGIEAQIHQKVLVLAGNMDMYVPTDRTPFLNERLVNASEVTSIIFDQTSGGQYHCQVGNKIVAFREILKFLNG